MVGSKYSVSSFQKQAPDHLCPCGYCQKTSMKLQCLLIRLCQCEYWQKLIWDEIVLVIKWRLSNIKVHLKWTVAEVHHASIECTKWCVRDIRHREKVSFSKKSRCQHQDFTKDGMTTRKIYNRAHLDLRQNSPTLQISLLILFPMHLFHAILN